MIRIRRTHFCTPALLALVIAIAAPTRAQDADPSQTEQRLRAAVTEAFARHDWPAAIAGGLKLVELLPNDPLAAYNLACAYARSGDAERGAQWVLTAAKKGFPYPTTFQTDSDLDPIRARPEYREALAIVLETHRRESEAFKRKADATRPLLINPPKYDKTKPAPLIIVLHGRGGTAKPIAEMWREAAAKIGAVIVAPQAPDRVEGAGFEWTKLEEGEYLVMHALEYAAKQREIDRSRVILAGFSQGGYLSFVVGHRHPEAFAGVIAIASSMDRLVTPPDSASAHKPRYYIMVGEHDAVADAARESHRLLLDAGFESELKIFEGLGHAMPQRTTEEMAAALAWALE